MENKKITWIIPGLILFCYSSFSLANIDEGQMKAKLRKVGVPFIENRGQINDNVGFYASTFGGTVFITKDGSIVYSLPKIEKDQTGKKAVAIKEVFVNRKVNNIVKRVNYIKWSC
ncbi:MAG: hypothetical protein NC913_02190 [Candidatus Omnitrophica bacterium]|nr:hypothetical protein [Candidatus Omnitrophota bacterium]